MAPLTGTRTHAESWTDFYDRNRKDGGPIQALFDTNAEALSKRAKDNLNDVMKFTEVIAGSAHGNIILVPGTQGTMQLIHHGFACNTSQGFVLTFAHGNLGDCTVFKTLRREEMVAPVEGKDIGDGKRAINAPSLESMLGAESPDEFGDLAAHDNEILKSLPNHCFVTPDAFIEVKGSKRISSKDLAYSLIEMFQMSVVNDDEISVEKAAEAEGLEGTLAMLWASENGLLKEIQLEDVPEEPMLSHIIKDIRGRLNGTTGSGTARPPTGTTGETSSMDMMALSSQTMVALLSKFQEGSETDRKKKESEKSILKTMGPTQRGLFTALCTRSMSHTPEMSEFMLNLTASKTPQKAINLLQSETRDWEGTFSVGGFHKMLSNGFLSQDANRANPGGFTVFMFYPKTADIGGKAFGKGDNELLREYLGMDVEESTLDYYLKQGYYTPSNPNDLRIQLQTALDMLELLTCDGTIAGKGLAHILEPRRWSKLTTILNDRFQSEAEFGAKFCYTLDRHLQTFLDKMTRWEDLETEGQPRYLSSKAEDLIEKLEDGQGLNIVLPVALRAGKMATASSGSSSANKRAAPVTPEKPKKPRATSDATDPDEGAPHANTEIVSAWQLPGGSKYVDLFGSKMPGLRGWPVLLDTRLSKKQNRSRKAPMCVRFQVTGKCKQNCTLSHVAASDMPEEARSKAADLFRTLYQNA
jgi:hypothetical protein